MHVLTKIFIVLVSLLAVLLVPLVVVYATNENTYKSQLFEAQAEAAAARETANAADSRYQAALAAKDSELGSVQARNAELQQQLTGLETSTIELRAEVDQAEQNAQQITAKLATIAETERAQARLTEQLVQEAAELRADNVDTQRRLVETDDALRRMTRELEVAEAARRSLQEEVQRLSEVEANLLTQLGVYVQRYGELEDIRTGDVGGDVTLPDRRIIAPVTDVRTTSDGRTLIEVDAGQKDGVKVGWEMTIGDNGNYIGKIRIINTDLNKSTGVVLEGSGSSAVRVGQRAHTWPGR